MKFDISNPAAQIVKDLADEVKAGKKAGTMAVKKVTEEFKLDMRRQAAAAGFAKRMQNTWRGDVYPKGKTSLAAAGLVYTKAPKIMINFEDGKVIRSNDGFFLAIPTVNAPKKIWGRKVTPELLERARGIRLRFVYRKSGPSLLVADNMQASYKKDTGELSGFRKAGKRNLAAGNVTTVVMFILVPQVRMPKKISLYKTAEKYLARLPGALDRFWTQNSLDRVIRR